MDATGTGTGARSRRLLGWIVGVTLVALVVWARAGTGLGGALRRRPRRSRTSC